MTVKIKRRLSLCYK